MTGGLYGSENGPTFGDEVNFLERGKNYHWGPVPPDLPAFRDGFRIIDWTPVIVPTGITFLGQGGFPAGSRTTSSSSSTTRGHPPAGALGRGARRLGRPDAVLDLDDEGSVDNKPLDAVEGPDGALWFSTFEGLWRVAPYESP